MTDVRHMTRETGSKGVFITMSQAMNARKDISVPSVRSVRGAVFLLLAAVCLLPLIATAELPEKRSQDLLYDAERIFGEANNLVSTDSDAARALYQTAAMRYEQIIGQGGIENGKLYYNLGNAYFRMGDIGRAILNYRRAGQYMPNDSNLRQNMEYARAKRRDRVDEEPKKQVLRTVFFWHYDLSTKVRSITFAVIFILAWVFATIRLFVRKAFAGWGLAITTIGACLLLGSLVTEGVGERSIQPGVITTDEVTARKGDSEAYEQSFKEPLHAGTEFILLEDRDTWYHIELVDTRTCWVPADSVELVRETNWGNE